MQDRFKFRLRIKQNFKTVNGTMQGIKTYYCNGFIEGKKKIYFFGDNKRYSFLKSSVIDKEQCTGLKDKNGKLIYEGDVVRVWKFSTGENSKRVVSWNEHRGGFRLYTIDQYKRNIHECPQSMVNVTTIEIIGNVYKTPELLEVEND